MAQEDYKIGSRTATSLVISSMIGTGVFTSLGFQLVDIRNTWSIILLWVIGGIIALIGAFTYAELGTHFKKSGGDYIFLSRTFHPIFGYIYAWTSLTVGFSAPVAIAALALSDYIATPLGLGEWAYWVGLAAILLLCIIHSVTIKVSGLFQDLSSLFKVLFVVGLILMGWYFPPLTGNAIVLDNTWTTELWKPGFAVSLIYVSYAYQGWNQSAYIIDEIDNPRKNLPISLIGGTLIVTLIYVGLQIVMLKHGQLDQLVGEAEVTTIAFANVLGDQGVFWISIFIAIQLVATISSYIWIGSRITQAMAAEHSLWSFLAHKSNANIPVRAIWFQAIISIGLSLTVSLEQVMLYAGFLLQLMSTLTILASFYIVPKEDGFKSPFGKTLQVIYILFSIVVIGYILYERPFESLMGLGLLVLGIITYFFNKKPNKPMVSTD